MIKYIETDEDKQIYCPAYHDGRIQKVFLKKNQQLVFSCEECDVTWFSLEDVFDEDKGVSFNDYIEELGHVPPEGPSDWSKVLELGDFVTFDEVAEIVKRLGIEVVVLE